MKLRQTCAGHEVVHQ